MDTLLLIFDVIKLKIIVSSMPCNICDLVYEKVYLTFQTQFSRETWKMKNQSKNPERDKMEASTQNIMSYESMLPEVAFVVRGQVTWP